LSEQIILGVIGFFSLLVTLLTATIGYFKVLRPQQKQNKAIKDVSEKTNGAMQRHYEILRRLDSHEEQIKNASSGINRNAGDVKDVREALSSVKEAVAGLSALLTQISESMRRDSR
jgi:uncharacterized protein YoxC